MKCAKLDGPRSGRSKTERSESGRSKNGRFRNQKSDDFKLTAPKSRNGQSQSARSRIRKTYGFKVVGHKIEKWTVFKLNSPTDRNWKVIELKVDGLLSESRPPTLNITFLMDTLN